MVELENFFVMLEGCVITTPAIPHYVRGLGYHCPAVLLNWAITVLPCWRIGLLPSYHGSGLVYTILIQLLFVLLVNGNDNKYFL